MKFVVRCIKKREKHICISKFIQLNFRMECRYICIGKRTVSVKEIETLKVSKIIDYHYNISFKYCLRHPIQ